MLVLGGSSDGAVADALAGLCRTATGARLAVSYLQLSGLKAFAAMAGHIRPDKVRIVCTEQHAITDPRAVMQALDIGFRVRRYSGDRIFHSKVYLLDRPGETRYLIGSSNLSHPALHHSVEANLTGTDDGTLSAWFDHLFENQAEEFTAELLSTMRARFAERVRAQVRISPPARRPGPATRVEDNQETLDSILGGLEEDPVLLNIDHAGNTVRSIAFARSLLRNGISNSKQQSELKQLGLVADGSPTALGKAAAAAESSEEFAEIWARWLHGMPGDHLMAINGNGRLRRAKRVFANFWTLRPEVTDYFLAHAENPDPHTRRTLQTIELLANLGGPTARLTLDDAQRLTPMLDDLSGLAPETRRRVRGYLDNKGTRTWGEPDRRLLPLAWRKAAES